MPRIEKVTKIIDGDTFLTDKRKNPVRLSGVDAPEKRHPGYQDAKKALQSLIADKKLPLIQSLVTNIVVLLPRLKLGRNP